MTLYAVGDVQGCADAFDALLDRISFDPTRDHLWLAGDLVNRGPDSLRALRAVVSLGEAATTVLGNHDLHLLATVAGVREPTASDTFRDVLGADDRDELVDWIRSRPLILRDRERRLVLVHAGIPPGWRVRDACRMAREVEARLRGPQWRAALADMYGQSPAGWREDLADAERLRYTINALTRMRYCYADGSLDFRQSGPPGSQPSELVPWFDHPGRYGRKWRIVFGHWSALGILCRSDVVATDSGCVWGRELTAVPLDPAGAPIAVSCTGPQAR